MSAEIEREITDVYRAIKGAVLGWNWQGAEEAFRSFADRHAEDIPAWYVDELLYAAMRLWAADRHRDVLRHFASFFDRALGRELCWNPEDAVPLAAAAEALA